MSTTVQSPLAGRAVRLEDVPDPIFAQAMVGPGAAVDPPHDVVDALAPISGKLLKMMPHAYIVLAADGTGVLVHLGIDTVQLNGEGFTLLAKEGDEVAAGQPVVIYDVPSVVAAGKNPIVPVIALEKQAHSLTIGDAVGTGSDVTGSDTLFTINA